MSKKRILNKFLILAFYLVMTVGAWALILWLSYQGFKSLN